MCNAVKLPTTRIESTCVVISADIHSAFFKAFEAAAAAVGYMDYAQPYFNQIVASTEGDQLDELVKVFQHGFKAVENPSGWKQAYAAIIPADQLDWLNFCCNWFTAGGLKVLCVAPNGVAVSHEGYRA